MQSGYIVVQGPAQQALWRYQHQERVQTQQVFCWVTWDVDAVGLLASSAVTPDVGTGPSRAGARILQLSGQVKTFLPTNLPSHLGLFSLLVGYITVREHKVPGSPQLLIFAYSNCPSFDRSEGLTSWKYIFHCVDVHLVHVCLSMLCLRIQSRQVCSDVLLFSCRCSLVSEKVRRGWQRQWNCGEYGGHNINVRATLLSC